MSKVLDAAACKHAFYGYCELCQSEMKRMHRAEQKAIGEELVALVHRVKANPLHTTDDEFARNLVQSIVLTYDIKRKG